MWTREAGLASLGFFAIAEGISPDGGFVTGILREGGLRPFLWNAELGLTPIDVIGGVGFDVATGGSAVVGNPAFLWTPSGGVVDLGVRDTLGVRASAFAVTPDARFVVGAVQRSALDTEAAIWTSASESVGLGFLPGHTTSAARAVSDDGAVVVGTSGSPLDGSTSFRPFRWTAADGMVDLGTLCPLCGGSATAVSADGSVVVGTSGFPFVWDSINGLRDLTVVLEEHGVDLTGWRSLSNIHDVSADGQVIVGEGLFFNRQQGWIATLPQLNTPPDCRQAVASPSEIWPPNRTLAPITILGLFDADGDPVTVIVDAILQDERPRFRGPIPSGLGTDSALVPAVRDGHGDGRVYHIEFTASDEFGGACSGTVRVCVPHDRGKGANCVDGGPLFDAKAR
jgi:probable HAF family extracellular repeat protein